MSAPRWSRLFHRVTPGLFGALASALLFASCEKRGTPDWDTPGVPPAEQAEAAPDSSAPPPAPAPALPPSVPATPPSLPETPGADAETAVPPENEAEGGFRFIAYNLKNWLTMDRPVRGGAQQALPKPDGEKQAAIALLQRHRPDVVGVCEIGSREDLSDLQQRLRSSGIDLPFSQFVGGADQVRHLALLSRFPITATASPARSEFQLEGKTYGIQRGILDATIDAHGKPYRFLGVHLKSQREVPEFDQAAARLSEAHLLRDHVDSILEGDPQARLIVYGDFNDTRRTPPFQTVTGTYNTPRYLTAIPFKDSLGQAWTQYWEYQDIYSRFDFVAVSAALRREANFQDSYIIDDPEWNQASDHRPVLAIFR